MGERYGFGGGFGVAGGLEVEVDCDGEDQACAETIPEEAPKGGSLELFISILMTRAVDG